MILHKCLALLWPILWLSTPAWVSRDAYEP